VNDKPLLVTIAQAARILSLHKNTVQTMCYTGEIRSIKIGKARRVIYQDLIRWIEEKYNEQTQGSGGGSDISAR
jgi:excisionase family DNA binding protein